MLKPKSKLYKIVNSTKGVLWGKVKPSSVYIRHHKRFRARPKVLSPKHGLYIRWLVRIPAAHVK